MKHKTISSFGLIVIATAFFFAGFAAGVICK